MSTITKPLKALHLCKQFLLTYVMNHIHVTKLYIHTYIISTNRVSVYVQ